MRIVYCLTFIIVLFAQNSIACDLRAIGFGKSQSTIIGKYDIKQKEHNSDVSYLNTRIHNLCKSENGIAELKFFKDQLFSVSLISNENDLVLFKLLEKNKIELTKKPNKAALKLKFASGSVLDEYYTQYEAEQQDNGFYERIVISSRELEKDYNEYVAKDEENAGK